MIDVWSGSSTINVYISSTSTVQIRHKEMGSRTPNRVYFRNILGILRQSVGQCGKPDATLKNVFP